ncbi:MAG TPA: biotin--[acetyl-CoA-carboxylase] ligase [Chloroflexota bacterium]|jgi:BirA family biotin operon repressor/biotin-[acetyl-CoA-carboxylase] ligase
MASDRLAAAVHSLPAPWQGHYFDTVDSTQDQARAAARNGAPTRSIFVADFQRTGRGRAARHWFAAPGSSLLVSILFRERLDSWAPRPWRYTSLASLAMLETIAPLAPSASVAIKWPNDIMLDDRKVAGVLAETRWNGRELQAVVGVGLNVSAGPLEEEAHGATSLQSASATAIDRGDLLLTFVSHLEVLLGQPDQLVHDLWASRLWRRGQRLRLIDGAEEQDVVVLGAGPDGSLRVRDPDGCERTTVTGELLA